MDIIHIDRNSNCLFTLLFRYNFHPFWGGSIIISPTWKALDVIFSVISWSTWIPRAWYEKFRRWTVIFYPAITNFIIFMLRKKLFRTVKVHLCFSGGYWSDGIETSHPPQLVGSPGGPHCCYYCWFSWEVFFFFG